MNQPDLLNQIDELALRIRLRKIEYDIAARDNVEFDDLKKLYMRIKDMAEELEMLSRHLQESQQESV